MVSFAMENCRIPDNHPLVKKAISHKVVVEIRSDTIAAETKCAKARLLILMGDVVLVVYR